MEEEAVGKTPSEEMKNSDGIDIATYDDLSKRRWDKHPLFLELQRLGYPEVEAYQIVANVEQQKTELLQDRVAYLCSAVGTFVVCWIATFLLPGGSAGDGIAKILSKVLGFVVAGIANSMDQPQIAKGAFWGNVIYLITFFLSFAFWA